MAFNFRHRIPQIQDGTIDVRIENMFVVASNALINEEVALSVQVCGYIFSW